MVRERFHKTELQNDDEFQAAKDIFIAELYTCVRLLWWSQRPKITHSVHCQFVTTGTHTALRLIIAVQTLGQLCRMRMYGVFVCVASTINAPRYLMGQAHRAMHEAFVEAETLIEKGACAGCVSHVSRRHDPRW